MKQTLLLAILLVALSMSVVAADTCNPEAQNACSVLTELGVVQGVSVPGIIPSEATINAYLLNGTVLANFEVVDGVLETITCCNESEQYTHTAYIENSAVIEEIRDSTEPLKLAEQKLDSGEIVLEAESFTDSVRLSVGKFFLKIGSWFS